MILAYHVIFGAYGFWLPNDPRGSWSEFVGSWELFRYGKATKTDARHSVATVHHDVKKRRAAKEELQRPPVQFNGHQARAVVRGFGNYVRSSGLVVRACAIMPDHAHLVMDPFRLDVEKVVIKLKAEATKQLIAEGIHPFGHLLDEDGKPPKCFSRGEWKVYLNSLEGVRRAIRCVENNPLKEGKRPQRWPFITPLRD